MNSLPYRDTRTVPGVCRWTSKFVCGVQGSWTVTGANGLPGTLRTVLSTFDCGGGPGSAGSVDGRGGKWKSLNATGTPTASEMLPCAGSGRGPGSCLVCRNNSMAVSVTVVGLPILIPVNDGTFNKPSCPQRTLTTPVSPGKVSSVVMRLSLQRTMIARRSDGGVNRSFTVVSGNSAVAAAMTRAPSTYSGKPPIVRGGGLGAGVAAGAGPTATGVRSRAVPPAMASTTA